METFPVFTIAILVGALVVGRVLFMPVVSAIIRMLELLQRDPVYVAMLLIVWALVAGMFVLAFAL